MDSSDKVNWYWVGADIVKVTVKCSVEKILKIKSWSRVRSGDMRCATERLPPLVNDSGGKYMVSPSITNKSVLYHSYLMNLKFTNNVYLYIYHCKI